MTIYKRDDMIQKGRFKLSAQEQRAVLYAIGKIKPNDSISEEYQFNIKEFYQICGIDDESYTRLKNILGKLSDNGWWVKLPDGSISRVRWFSTVKINKKSGIVYLKFHEDMMPYLLQVAEQDEFYTFYRLKYVLPMSSKHSPRLYEILKSYQKNNREWWFELDQLRNLMNADKYKRWPDFRRYVLDVAVEEINRYTDIVIRYYTQGTGRRVERVVFLMDDRTSAEKFYLDQEIDLALDGQLSFFEVTDAIKVKSEFLKERRAAKREE